MDYFHYAKGDSNSFKYALLIKGRDATSRAFKKAVESYYITPLVSYGVSKEDILVIALTPEDGKSFKAKESKALLDKIQLGLEKLGTTKILMANGDLYKYLTGVPKTSDCFGESRKGELPGFENIDVVLSIDYNALMYNESLRFKLDNSIEVFATTCLNTLKLDKDIIHSMYIPVTAEEIENYLDALHQHTELACDIETESLRFERARICTIAFAWDKHNGIVFSVDTDEEEKIKALLRKFFINYQGELLFHNALYDCKVIIYQLFMETSLDIDGLIEGLKTFNKNVDDTMLVTYLATNSTQEAPLGLKENSFEFAGNYGIEFKEDKDIHKYPRKEILEYNLKDALCTCHVMEKYWQKMIDDDQKGIYDEIFIPSIMPNLYMMLIGMMMDIKEVRVLDAKLDTILTIIESELQRMPEVIETIALLKERRRVKDNTDRVAKAKNPDKIKIKTLDDIKDEPFNPNSDPQKQVLLYEIMELPVINTTDTGAPSCDDNTLKALLNRVGDPQTEAVIKRLRDYAAASIVSSTFVKAFLRYAFEREDGSFWLNGNKKLGGTQSGRGSSNSPNMENIPHHSKYGEMIMKCFIAPDGYLIGGADFSSLEDRINAILTQDPNKVKVYTDGNSVESINSIEEVYPKLRQESKVPTFALTYQGTWHTLFKNLGLSKPRAQQIEKNYHELYKVSDEWTEKQLEFATEHGYVECAFGLKLRTPFLKKTIRTKKHNVYHAEKEGRSAANAITQSWGMLLNRTAITIINKIIYSEHYATIYPINTIHDAIYFLFYNDPEVIKWLNDNLIAEMEWNDHPKIKSTDVPMKAQLSMGLNWYDQHNIPNQATIAEIKELLQKI
jgi:DNA polymerase-1